MSIDHRHGCDACRKDLSDGDEIYCADCFEQTKMANYYEGYEKGYETARKEFEEKP